MVSVPDSSRNPRVRQPTGGSILSTVAVSTDYLQYVLEQLAPVPRVTSRRMFGAVGLYSDGFFFGLIDDDTLFFKVDDSNRGDYLARNMSALRPFKDKPDLSISYFEVPADALEDRDELASWARKSVAVAVASARPRRPRAEASATRAKAKTGAKVTASRKIAAGGNPPQQGKATPRRTAARKR
jgi:DNA transformation protein